MVKVYGNTIDITISPNENGGNIVSVPELSGKLFELSRRGVGDYMESEFQPIAGGGFRLLDGTTVATGEVFFARTYTQQNSSEFADFGIQVGPFVQYPHSFIATVVMGGGYDTMGDILTTPVKMTVTKQCRLEDGAGSGYVVGVDGSKINFSWIVYIPLPIEVVPVGSKVQVKNSNGDVLCNDSVKQMIVGQLNARVWL